jgi:glycerol-3-phosphate acyltransferase PlsY
VPLLVVAAVVVFAHRGNIKKLAYGQERKFSVHKRGGQKDGR